MAKRKTQTIRAWAPNDRDLEIVARLERKTGLNHSNLVRLALHHFAEFHGIREDAPQRKNPLEKGAKS